MCGVGWGLLQVATHQSALVMRDMDSLLAEAQTLLCLLVALQCAQELIQRLGNILCRSHGTDGSGEAVCRGCAYSRAYSARYHLTHTVRLRVRLPRGYCVLTVRLRCAYCALAMRLLKCAICANLVRYA